MSVGDTTTRIQGARAGSQPSRPWLPAAMLVTAHASPGDAGRGRRLEPATGNGGTKIRRRIYLGVGRSFVTRGFRRC